MGRDALALRLKLVLIWDITSSFLKDSEVRRVVSLTRAVRITPTGKKCNLVELLFCRAGAPVAAELGID
jgi:hypothetical protein